MTTTDVSLSVDTRALAAKANAEHDFVLGKARDMVVHAMAAGDALSTVRDSVATGEWSHWCDENLTFSKATVCIYIRLATYREVIEQQIAAGGAGSLVAALSVVRGLPDTNPRGLPRAPKALVATMRKMSSGGASRQEIAATLGVSVTTVLNYLDPESARARQARAYARKKQASAAQRALETAENAALVKRHGGSVSKAYSLIRKAAVDLDDALANASGDAAVHLRKALYAVHTADNEIVAALKGT